MNLIRKAIDDIKAVIPMEVLRMAYESTYYQTGYFQYSPRSIDDLILEQTIHARVLVDSNIVGGDEIVISANGLVPRYIDDNNMLYEIPAERVGHRTIMTVLSANYFQMASAPGAPFTGIPAITPQQGSDLTMSGHRAMDSRSSIPIIGTHECTVVGHNNIMVRNHIRGGRIQQFRVIVSNDNDLQNINFRSALSFSKLCQYAVKSFIYTKLIIKLDRGAIDRGHEIASIKSYVENCADAEENYKTYLEEVWQGVTTFNNKLGYENLLKIQISPSI